MVTKYLKKLLSIETKLTCQITVYIQIVCNFIILLLLVHLTLAGMRIGGTMMVHSTLYLWHILVSQLSTQVNWLLKILIASLFYLASGRQPVLSFCYFISFTKMLLWYLTSLISGLSKVVFAAPPFLFSHKCLAFPSSKKWGVNSLELFSF